MVVKQILIILAIVLMQSCQEEQSKLKQLILEPKYHSGE